MECACWRTSVDAREALGVVAAGRTLARDEARAAMASVMAGEATPAQLGALLAALHVRGESVDEIAGFATALREVAVRVTVTGDAMDIVGTGGDRSNSFNISTVSSLVVAPAGGRRMLLGVPSPALGEKIARVLSELGTEHALVVHGEDGLDEISPSGPTRTWEVRGGSVREGRIDPKELGVAAARREEIVGGDPARNAAMARRVLGGASDGTRSAILLNAGAACYVAGLANDVRQGMKLAADAIDRGRATEVLERFITTSQRLGLAEAAQA